MELASRLLFCFLDPARRRKSYFRAQIGRRNPHDPAMG